MVLYCAYKSHNSDQYLIFSCQRSRKVIKSTGSFPFRPIIPLLYFHTSYGCAVVRWDNKLIRFLMLVSSYLALSLINCIKYCNLHKIQDAITSLSGPSHKSFLPHQRVFESGLYYFYNLTTAIMLWENYRNDGTLFFSLQRSLSTLRKKWTKTNLAGDNSYFLCNCTLFTSQMSIAVQLYYPTSTS